MALLRQLSTRRGLPLQPAVLYTASRQAGGKLLQDFIPGPYPTTEKERLEAAKKYGLLPHEYTPIADDGLGRGDYPDLPHVGADSKDPWYPWDYPEFRKNYGEAWHADSDIYGQDKFDPAKKWYPSPLYMMGMLFGTVFGLFGVMKLLKPYPIHRPVCQKQLPGEGKVHYSFERP